MSEATSSGVRPEVSTLRSAVCSYAARRTARRGFLIWTGLGGFLGDRRLRRLSGTIQFRRFPIGFGSLFDAIGAGCDFGNGRRHRPRPLRALFAQDLGIDEPALPDLPDADR